MNWTYTTFRQTEMRGLHDWTLPSPAFPFVSFCLLREQTEGKGGEDTRRIATQFGSYGLPSIWNCYLMVLHGVRLYDLVSYVYIYIACFCVFRFFAWAVSRKTPIPLMIFLQYFKVIFTIFSRCFHDIFMRCSYYFHDICVGCWMSLSNVGAKSQK